MLVLIGMCSELREKINNYFFKSYYHYRFIFLRTNVQYTGLCAVFEHPIDVTLSRQRQNVQPPMVPAAAIVAVDDNAINVDNVPAALNPVVLLERLPSTVASSAQNPLNDSGNGNDFEIPEDARKNNEIQKQIENGNVPAAFNPVVVLDRRLPTLKRAHHDVMETESESDGRENQQQQQQRPKKQPARKAQRRQASAMCSSRLANMYALLFGRNYVHLICYYQLMRNDSIQYCFFIYIYVGNFNVCRCCDSIHNMVIWCTTTQKSIQIQLKGNLLTIKLVGCSTTAFSLVVVCA